MQEQEIINIDGAKLTIWLPAQGASSSWSISDCGGWLDGVYDSRESAILGYKLSTSGGEGEANGYSRLNALSKRVCQQENRLITVDDFD